MKYNRETLQIMLNSFFIDEKLEGIFYHSDYQGFETFNQFSAEVQEVPVSAILIRTGSGKFISIMSTDYSPYYGYLSGIALSGDVTEPYDRPNHINDEAWKVFTNSKIEYVSIIEYSTKINDELLTLPFGLKFGFESKKVLHIFNLGIEGFLKEESIFEFRVGGALTIFFNEDAVARHNALALTDLQTFTNGE